MSLGKLGQALTAREIFDLIQEDLAQVEKRLSAESIASVDAVTAIIPGAKNPQQAQANVRASSLPPLSAELHSKLREFYEREVAAHIRGPY